MGVSPSFPRGRYQKTKRKTLVRNGRSGGMVTVDERHGEQRLEYR